MRSPIYVHYKKHDFWMIFIFMSLFLELKTIQVYKSSIYILILIGKIKRKSN